MPHTKYIWDPLSDYVLMEKDENGDTQATNTYLPELYGDMISQRRDGETSYYHFDGQGSTRALTDENEDVTDTYTYTAFGEEVSKTGTTENPYRYVGEKGYYFDEETDDYYVRARTYEPNIIRWRSKDPRSFVDGTNIYSYVLNNPANRVDPTGFQGEASRGQLYVGLDIGYIWCGNEIRERPFSENAWILKDVFELGPALQPPGRWIEPAKNFSPVDILPTAILPARRLEDIEITLEKSDLDMIRPNVSKKEFDRTWKAIKSGLFDEESSAIGYKPFVALVQDAVKKKMGEVGGAVLRDVLDIAAQEAGFKEMQQGQGLLIFEGLSGDIDYETFKSSPELILKGKVRASIGVKLRRRWTIGE